MTTTVTTVETTEGVVRGRVDRGVHSFLGVPYAAPPTGARRFAPPEPPEPWTGVRDATRSGATAPQPPIPGGLFPQTLVAGDDVLHLDVRTPAPLPAPAASPAGPPRPVLVWIHGGGFVQGGNADVHLAGLARRGLVTVAINHRLGVDGFLVLDDAPPNRGVLDWLSALAWVRDNIGRFGGDPANVTVAGHSAGAVACLVLATVPRAAGLFRRVVAMSGTPWNLVDVATARPLGAEMVGRAGAPPTVAGVGALPVDELMALQHAVAPVAGIGTVGDPLDLVEHLATLRMWLGPVVDGDLVPDHPFAALATAGTDLPVVVGSAVGEVDPLIAYFGGGLTAADADLALARLGLDGPELAAWRARQPDRTPAEELGAVLTALSFRIPALTVAETRAGATTFVYETTWRAPTPLGTFHGVDVPFAWDAIEADEVATLCGGPPPPSLADDMAGALVRFACDGDPGWPAYDLDTRTEMAFDVPSHLRHDPDPAARALFGPLRTGR